MLILSFLVPVLLWLLAIAVCGIFPFGEYTLLTSDMYFQYTHYRSSARFRNRKRQIDRVF